MMVAAFMTTSSKAELRRHGLETASGGGCNTCHHIFILPCCYCCVSPAVYLTSVAICPCFLFFLKKKQKSLRWK